MKKLIVAVITLIGFGTASFAQQTPAVKKTEPSKIHSPKKQTEVKASTKEESLQKAETPAAEAKHGDAKHSKKHKSHQKHSKTKKKEN